MLERTKLLVDPLSSEASMRSCCSRSQCLRSKARWESLQTERSWRYCCASSLANRVAIEIGREGRRALDMAMSLQRDRIWILRVCCWETEAIREPSVPPELFRRVLEYARLSSLIERFAVSSLAKSIAEFVGATLIGALVRERCLVALAAIATATMIPATSQPVRRLFLGGMFRIAGGGVVGSGVLALGGSDVTWECLVSHQDRRSRNAGGGRVAHLAHAWRACAQTGCMRHS